MLSANNNVCLTKKHSLKSKWNILFDKSPEWIAFKPQLGLKVYPCYSCKNMFSSKLTFQDHINRRVIIIKYKCGDCTNTFTFYNRCALLLHARKHFSLSEGHVNLANVDIHLLPIELAGFARHESIPFLYDEEEEYVDGAAYVNCQFYTPDDSEAGKQMITLRPFNLVFHYAEGGNNVLLVLKQICSNVPLCEFVTQHARVTEPRVEPEIKQEFEDDDFIIPVISKIESLNQNGKDITCPECSEVEVSMAKHFLGHNRPLNSSLCCQICKFVAPTKCSLAAHVRTHEKAAPFVCPECGKTFNSTASLNNHMEEVCFHLSKNVRFRCPAQKCGKIFVLPNTYASHFINHMQNVNKCSVCGSMFVCNVKFAEHALTHGDNCVSLKCLNCLVCKQTVIADDSSQHISWHLQDREMSVYIFTCKFCRSYFRSPATFSVHKKRCLKNDKIQPVLYTTNCQFCGQKLQYREKENFKSCIFCKQVNQIVRSDDKKTTCMLCKEDINNDEKKDHAAVCKYNNPVVAIQNIDTSSKEEETSSSDANLDSSNDSVRTDDMPKPKKRKRNTNNAKSKKNEEILDLQAEQPVAFDGTYYCKLCDYKNTKRAEFHGHILSHRDISTSYQCMECGECFVVKPSLIKHLAHFHKISDYEKYFIDNDCFDKFAIEELENNLKMIPGEHRIVNENQCSICLEQFDDALSLDKHFRIHGMAFLLKKTK